MGMDLRSTACQAGALPVRQARSPKHKNMTSPIKHDISTFKTFKYLRKHHLGSRNRPYSNTRRNYLAHYLLTPRGGNKLDIKPSTSLM